VVTVDGVGSTWTCSGSISVGSNGAATLTISGGAGVTATGVSLNNKSLLAIDIGRGSLLTLGGGTGTVTNYGTIRLLAGAGVPANTTQYSPISAGTWGGLGKYQAIGGTWDATGHTFAASSVTPGTSVSGVSLDLAAVQRALIDDAGTGWEIGASFPAAGTTTNISFTATPVGGDTLNALQSQLPTNESLLSGWTFATTGYSVSATNPVYLSFKVGAGYPADDLEIWHYVGSTWTPYAATDLTYDGNYASFTASDLSGYAVSGIPVPEPGTLALLAVGFVGLLTFARRKRA
jgi:T5SS/PEP-CTERM-associated repeat protein